MNTNQFLTGAAVAFAVYAVWFVNRTPGKVVATQPAQQQRDGGLSIFLDQVTGQQTTLYTNGVSWEPAQSSATLNSLYGAAGYG